MVAPLRVVFLGTPHFAVPTLEHLLDSAHTVVGVVTQPDRPRGRGQRVTDAPVKARAVQRGLPILQPPRLREPEVEERLRAWSADLGVVAAYGKIIPDHLLAVPRLGMINVHASLLPKYRGAAPVHRAVMAGDTETGVTIMRVITELDAGGMFATARRPIGPDETSEEVERGLAEIGARLLVETVDALARGAAVETPQDSAAATFAPRLTKEEGLIDWSQPAQAVHNKVRGLHPWPHAFTSVGGTRIIVLTTHVQDRSGPMAGPGTVLEGPRGALQVAAGDGRVVAIARLQLEGKRPMEAREFLAGRPVPPGTRLGGP